jgi:hypothetical protein
MNALQTLFNFANSASSIGVRGSCFFWCTAPARSTRAPPVGDHRPDLASDARYFMLNSGLTAAVIALSGRKSPLTIWTEHYWPLFPSTIAGASVALLLVLAFRKCASPPSR